MRSLRVCPRKQALHRQLEPCNKNHGGHECDGGRLLDSCIFLPKLAGHQRLMESVEVRRRARSYAFSCRRADVGVSAKARVTVIYTDRWLVTITEIQGHRKKTPTTCASCSSSVEATPLRSS